MTKPRQFSVTWSYQKNLLPKRDKKSHGACLTSHTVMGKMNHTDRIARDRGGQSLQVISVQCVSCFLKEKMVVPEANMASPEIKMPCPGLSTGVKPNTDVPWNHGSQLGRDRSLVITGLRIHVSYGPRDMEKHQTISISIFLRRNHLKCLSLSSQEGVMKNYYNYLLK